MQNNQNGHHHFHIQVLVRKDESSITYIFLEHINAKKSNLLHQNRLMKDPKCTSIDLQGSKQ